MNMLLDKDRLTAREYMCILDMADTITNKNDMKSLCNFILTAAYRGEPITDDYLIECFKLDVKINRYAKGSKLPVPFKLPFKLPFKNKNVNIPKKSVPVTKTKTNKKTKN